MLTTAIESLFVYSKSSNFSYHDTQFELKEKKEGYWRATDDSAGVRYPPERIIDGKTYYPRKKCHFKFSQKNMDRMYAEGKIRINDNTKRLQYFVEPRSEGSLDTNWTDITGYSFKTGYKNGVEHGKYIEYDEGYLYMEGEMVNGLAEGEWIGYEYGRVVWTEDVKNDITINLIEFLYYDNGQISEKNSYNGSEELHGVSEAYHTNGQLESKTLYENGELVRIIEKYDFNGNPLIR